MNASSSAAATLSNDARKRLALLSLVKAESVAHLADQEGVSRQFIYRQKHKVVAALDYAFSANDVGVLFNLPVTQAWLDQLMLSLTLICRSSCREMKELLRDMLGVSVSVGTIRDSLGNSDKRQSGNSAQMRKRNARIRSRNETVQKESHCGIQGKVALAAIKATSKNLPHYLAE